MLLGRGLRPCDSWSRSRIALGVFVGALLARCYVVFAGEDNKTVVNDLDIAGVNGSCVLGLGPLVTKVCVHQLAIGTSLNVRIDRSLLWPSACLTETGLSNEAAGIFLLNHTGLPPSDYTGPSNSAYHVPELVGLYGNLSEVPVNVTAMGMESWNDFKVNVSDRPDVSKILAPYAAWSVTPATLSELYEKGRLLQPLDKLLTATPQLQTYWQDIPPVFRDLAGLYDGAIFGIPYSAEVPLMFWRKDVFEKRNLTAPSTWEETLALARILDGTQAPCLKDTTQSCQMHGFCFGLLDGCFYDGLALTTIWASMAGAGGTRAGLFFDPTNMEPMFTGPAMAEAIRIFRELSALGPPPEGKCQRLPHSYFLQRCLLAVSLSSLFKVAAYTPTRRYIGSLLGISILPGSHVVQSRATGRLELCSRATCPFASAAPAGLHTGLLISRVPYLGRGALALALNRRAPVNHALAALRAFTFALTYHDGWPSVLDPTSRTSPVRAAHLSPANLHRWVEAGYQNQSTQAFLAVLAESMSHPCLAGGLRALGSLDMEVALGEVAAMAVEGTIATPYLLEFLAGRYRTLLQRYYASDQARLQLAYWRDIGYVPAGPQSPSDPGGSGTGGAHAMSTGMILGVAIAGAVLLAAAVALAALWMRHRAKRRGHSRQLRPVAAPGYSPDTSLCITDIQSSTQLWEDLEPEVMDAALSLHNSCVRGLLTKHQGYECHTEGDSFIMAFHTPASAVAFALELQVELLTLPWSPELLQQEPCAPVYQCANMLALGMGTPGATSTSIPGPGPDVGALSPSDSLAAMHQGGSLSLARDSQHGLTHPQPQPQPQPQPGAHDSASLLDMVLSGKVTSNMLNPAGSSAVSASAPFPPSPGAPSGRTSGAGGFAAIRIGSSRRSLPGRILAGAPSPSLTPTGTGMLALTPPPHATSPGMPYHTVPSDLRALHEVVKRQSGVSLLLSTLRGGGGGGDAGSANGAAGSLPSQATTFGPSTPHELDFHDRSNRLYIGSGGGGVPGSDSSRPAAALAGVPPPADTSFHRGSLYVPPDNERDTDTRSLAARSRGRPASVPQLVVQMAAAAAASGSGAGSGLLPDSGGAGGVCQGVSLHSCLSGVPRRIGSGLEVEDEEEDRRDTRGRLLVQEEEAETAAELGMLAAAAAGGGTAVSRNVPPGRPAPTFRAVTDGQLTSLRSGAVSGRIGGGCGSSGQKRFGSDFPAGTSPVTSQGAPWAAAAVAAGVRPGTLSPPGILPLVQHSPQHAQQVDVSLAIRASPARLPSELSRLARRDGAEVTPTAVSPAQAPSACSGSCVGMELFPRGSSGLQGNTYPQTPPASRVRPLYGEGGTSVTGDCSEEAPVLAAASAAPSMGVAAAATAVEASEAVSSALVRCSPASHGSFGSRGMDARSGMTEGSQESGSGTAVTSAPCGRAIAEWLHKQHVDPHPHPHHHSLAAAVLEEGVMLPEAPEEAENISFSLHVVTPAINNALYQDNDVSAAAAAAAAAGAGSGRVLANPHPGAMSAFGGSAVSAAVASPGEFPAGESKRWAEGEWVPPCPPLAVVQGLQALRQVVNTGRQSAAAAGGGGVEVVNALPASGPAAVVATSHASAHAAEAGGAVAVAVQHNSLVGPRRCTSALPPTLSSFLADSASSREAAPTAGFSPAALGPSIALAPPVLAAQSPTSGTVAVEFARRRTLRAGSPLPSFEDAAATTTAVVGSPGVAKAAAASAAAAEFPSLGAPVLLLPPPPPPASVSSPAAVPTPRVQVPPRAGTPNIWLSTELLGTEIVSGIDLRILSSASLTDSASSHAPPGVTTATAAAAVGAAAAGGGVVACSSSSLTAQGQGLGLGPPVGPGLLRRGVSRLGVMSSAAGPPALPPPLPQQNQYHPHPHNHQSPPLPTPTPHQELPGEGTPPSGPADRDYQEGASFSDTRELVPGAPPPPPRLSLSNQISGKHGSAVHTSPSSRRRSRYSPTPGGLAPFSIAVSATAASVSGAAAAASDEVTLRMGHRSATIAGGGSASVSGVDAVASITTAGNGSIVSAIIARGGPPSVTDAATASSASYARPFAEPSPVLRPATSRASQHTAPELSSPDPLMRSSQPIPLQHTGTSRRGSVVGQRMMGALSHANLSIPGMSRRIMPGFHAVSPGPYGPSAAAPGVLCFRGFRVRVGVCSGLEPGRDVVYQKDLSRRMAYSGCCMQLTKLVSDAALGGMVLLGASTVERLLPLPRKDLPGLVLWHKGRFTLLDTPRGSDRRSRTSHLRNLHPLPSRVAHLSSAVPSGYSVGLSDSLDLYQAMTGALVGRQLLLEPLPLRTLGQVLPGVLGAPVGCVVLALVQVAGLGLLREWSDAVTREAEGLLYGTALEQLRLAGGYPAAVGDGQILAAFTSPVSALRWLVCLEEELRCSVPWPQELLQHELGDELVVSVPAMTYMTAPAAQPMNTGPSVQCAGGGGVDSGTLPSERGSGSGWLASRTGALGRSDPPSWLLVTNGASGAAGGTASGSGNLAAGGSFAGSGNGVPRLPRRRFSLGGASGSVGSGGGGSGGGPLGGSGLSRFLRLPRSRAALQRGGVHNNLAGEGPIGPIGPMRLRKAASGGTGRLAAAGTGAGIGTGTGSHIGTIGATYAASARKIAARRVSPVACGSADLSGPASGAACGSSVCSRGTSAMPCGLRSPPARVVSVSVSSPMSQQTLLSGTPPGSGPSTHQERLTGGGCSGRPSVPQHMLPVGCQSDEPQFMAPTISGQVIETEVSPRGNVGLREQAAAAWAAAVAAAAAAVGPGARDVHFGVSGVQPLPAAAAAACQIEQVLTVADVASTPPGTSWPLRPGAKGPPVLPRFSARGRFTPPEGSTPESNEGLHMALLLSGEVAAGTGTSHSETTRRSLRLFQATRMDAAAAAAAADAAASSAGSLPQPSPSLSLNQLPALQPVWGPLTCTNHHVTADMGEALTYSGSLGTVATPLRRSNTSLPISSTRVSPAPKHSSHQSPLDTAALLLRVGATVTRGSGQQLPTGQQSVPSARCPGPGSIGGATQGGTPWGAGTLVTSNTPRAEAGVAGSGLGPGGSAPQLMMETGSNNQLAQQHLSDSGVTSESAALEVTAAMPPLALPLPPPPPASAALPLLPDSSSGKLVARSGAASAVSPTTPGSVASVAVHQQLVLRGLRIRCAAEEGSFFHDGSVTAARLYRNQHGGRPYGRLTKLCSRALMGQVLCSWAVAKKVHRAAMAGEAAAQQLRLTPLLGGPAAAGGQGAAANSRRTLGVSAGSLAAAGGAGVLSTDDGGGTEDAMAAAAAAAVAFTASEADEGLMSDGRPSRFGGGWGQHSVEPPGLVKAEVWACSLQRAPPGARCLQ